jgi:hypothetical protein
MVNVIFMDTEGLGDCNKDENNDVRIFLLAVLISSHCIFNCTGAIDNSMIEQLGLVTEMSQRIQLSNGVNPGSVDPKEYQAFFPALTVLVRDFYLVPKDEKGQTITPN